MRAVNEEPRRRQWQLDRSVVSKIQCGQKEKGSCRQDDGSASRDGVGKSIDGWLSGLGGRRAGRDWWSWRRKENKSNVSSFDQLGLAAQASLIIAMPWASGPPLQLSNRVSQVVCGFAGSPTPTCPRNTLVKVTACRKTSGFSGSLRHGVPCLAS